MSCADKKPKLPIGNTLSRLGLAVNTDMWPYKFTNYAFTKPLFGNYVPSCQELRYFSCSAESVSIERPMAANLVFATISSMALGTS